MEQQRQVSVKDIAAELHISLSTVHKALTGKAGVGDKRRREVLECAERLGYTVNTAAQSLSRKGVRLGIVMPTAWQEYFGPIREGMEARITALRECRVEAEFCYLPRNNPADGMGILQNFLAQHKPDAVLYCPSHHCINEAAVSVLSHVTVPVFWVGGGDHNPLGAPAIAIDAVLCGKMAADFLSCAVQRHMHAAVFTGSLQSAVHKAKTDAFCTRIAQNGGRVVKICETEDDPDRALEAVRALFAQMPHVNAVYVSTLTSEPICRYLDERGLAGHVALIGTDLFDGLRDFVRRGVMQATVFQNQRRVGEEAVKYAFEYLNKKSSYGNTGWQAREKILICPQLLLRANIE